MHDESLITVQCTLYLFILNWCSSESESEYEMLINNFNSLVFKTSIWIKWDWCIFLCWREKRIEIYFGLQQIFSILSWTFRPTGFSSWNNWWLCESACAVNTKTYDEPLKHLSQLKLLVTLVCICIHVMEPELTARYNRNFTAQFRQIVEAVSRHKLWNIWSLVITKTTQ